MGRKEKPYFCLDCKSTDSNNFYPRKKSRCKSCLSAHNKNLYNYKSKYKCKKCSDTDSNNFYTSNVKVCKKCISITNKNLYLKHQGQFPNSVLTEEEVLEKLYRKNLNSREYSKYWQQKNLFRFRVSAARHRCKKKKLPFDITEDFIKELWNKQNGKCYYSGIDMIIDKRNTPHSMSLDRKDSAKGYTQDNVVLTSFAINTMKLNFSISEFLEIIKALYIKNH